MNTPLQKTAQELVDRIADLGASPLDWAEYTALEKALADEQAQAVEPTAVSNLACNHDWVRSEQDQPWLVCEKCGLDYSSSATTAGKQAQAVEPAVNEDAARAAAWEILKPQLGTEGWTVGDHCNYLGFFGWGWEARRQYTHPAPPPAQQVLSLDLLERLSKTLINLGYSTPEGGMEHFGARIESQLYNLCNGVDSILAQQVAVPATGERAEFEAWAKREGLNTQRAESKNEDRIPSSRSGLCPATYYFDEVECAWRAWANKPVAQQVAVPESMVVSTAPSYEFANGWNAYRSAMLTAQGAKK